ncbi:MAG TPA: transglutaminase domain-containing protein, partial [Candidatus Saccharimonadia bacterium]|nr:transglutaminase domain-containing protein [Candidatus Saccharimonadia bacterium]
AKSKLPAALVHLVGAGVGAALVIVLVADVNSSAAELSAQIHDLSASLDRFAIDLLVRQVRSPETSAFLLVTGCIAWATGAYAAFAVFRRHRPMDALVVLGLLLLANISLSFEFLFPFLVIFATAGLLLLVRANLNEQRSGWLRRRIGDAGHVSGLFMRSGLTFVAVAVVGAVLLTTVASSDPLAGMWRSHQSELASLGQQLNQWVGGLTAPARGPNNLFGTSMPIQSRWESDPAIAYLAKPSDGKAHYWRVATYDRFNGSNWDQTDRVGVRVQPGDEILGVTTREGIELATRDPIDVEFTAIQPSGDSVLSPEAPETIADRAVNVTLKGEGGPFQSASFADGLREGDRYVVSALVRRINPDEGLNQARLNAINGVYPSYIEPYGEIVPGSIGQVTKDVAKEILDSIPPDQQTNFAIAHATETYLRDPANGFRYQTNVTGLCDSGQLVDCFLRPGIRKGFCQQFASAMVMLLRENFVAARLAMGYLPGKEQTDGVWQVDRASAHAWVEVYFPGEGWVQFDPTPGTQERGGVATRLPPGHPVATASPGTGPSGSPAARTFAIDEPGQDALGGGTPLAPPGGPGGGLLAIVLVGILMVGFGIAAYSVRERRRPSPAPEVVFGSVARLAARFGYGQRPTQTTYEYADALGDVIPAARDELALVARVKVETQYARRTPAPDVLLAVRHAYRRIRIRLLTLVFRRPRRRMH